MPKYPVPRWVFKRLDEHFMEGLLDAHMGRHLDEYTDRHVQRVLFRLRLTRAVRPYLYIFTFLNEVIHGKYWRAAKKVHGGSDPTSGASAGAGSLPVAQFTSYAGGFAAPTFSGAGIGSGFPAGAGYIPQASPSAVFEDSGIKAGEVTGYRCWKLKPDGLLHSVVYSDYTWKPGEIAEGDPSSDPHAGIYAYKSVLELHNYGSPERGTVSGTVDMWGEVYEHTRGYRAQYAAIASIDDSPYYDAAALRELYGLNKKKSVRKKKKA